MWYHSTVSRQSTSACVSKYVCACLCSDKQVRVYVILGLGCDVCGLGTAGAAMPPEPTAYTEGGRESEREIEREKESARASESNQAIVSKAARNRPKLQFCFICATYYPIMPKKRFLSSSCV